MTFCLSLVFVDSFPFCLAGKLFPSHGPNGHSITAITSNSVILMELNLLSSNPSERTLIYIVDGVVQKYYITHIPESVRFVVCLTPSLSIFFLSLLFV